MLCKIFFFFPATGTLVSALSGSTASLDDASAPVLGSYLQTNCGPIYAVYHIGVYFTFLLSYLNPLPTRLPHWFW